MKNPFRYGTVVDGEYFTDRFEELQSISRLLDSDNHLVLISPRRFGKSSLVQKAVRQNCRPYSMLNLQNVGSVEDRGAKLLKGVFKLYPLEKAKHYISHFRFVPTLSINPMNDGIDVAFQPSMNANVMLEDVLALIEKVGAEGKKLIVIFDEFQEILQISKGLDKQLRSFMQMHNHVNYIILGSQESMMQEIFERKKSPFYHFGLLMRLSKIPYSDFHLYITQRLSTVMGSACEATADEILSFTNLHPYYTQQLASQVWELAYYEKARGNLVERAIEKLTLSHDLDFERLWVNFNRMDKRIVIALCSGKNPLQDRMIATSTAYSSIKRLIKKGFVIQADHYEMEDPFFARWIQRNVL